MEELLEILTEVCPGIDFELETALVDDGILEPLDIETIVSEIRDAFDVEIPAEDMTAENFNSAESIMELIESYR